MTIDPFWSTLAAWVVVAVAWWITWRPGEPMPGDDAPERTEEDW